MKAVLAALLLTAACQGETGTIAVTLTTAPGSTLLDGVQTLRMVVTNPRKVVTAERDGDGFAIDLELPAMGTLAAIQVDGLDAAGSVIASGASPPFAFGGLDGGVVVYMAEPNSLGAAPTVLDPPRSLLGVGQLTYGGIFLGGRLENDAPSDAVQIYNAFNHTLLTGAPLPAPRAAPSVGVGTLGVYMLGGLDASGSLTSTLVRYDPNVAPAGQYVEYGERPGFTRAYDSLVPIGNERFLVTGIPPGELHGLDGSLVQRDDIAALPPSGVSVVANDGLVATILVGVDAIVRCRASECSALPLPGRGGATAVPLPGGKVGIACVTTDLLRIDAASGSVETFAGIPSTAKADCAVASTSRHLVIAGGISTTGIEGTVEVYDAATLTLVTTATLAVPRGGATAIPLPNDQVLIVGGVDANGAPIATIELFTPSNPNP